MAKANACVLPTFVPVGVMGWPSHWIGTGPVLLAAALALFMWLIGMAVDRRVTRIKQVMGAENRARVLVSDGEAVLTILTVLIHLALTREKPTGTEKRGPSARSISRLTVSGSAVSVSPARFCG